MRGNTHVFSDGPFRDEGDEVFLVAGDYEKATDFIEWDRAAIYLEAYFRELGFWNPYVKLCVQLLLSPRYYVSSNTILLEEASITERGCLMGEQGTKIILTLLTRGIEFSSRREDVCL
jgi:hypothetical protein